jgi:hypothetical protein
MLATLNNNTYVQGSHSYINTAAVLGGFGFAQLQGAAACVYDLKPCRGWCTDCMWPMCDKTLVVTNSSQGAQERKHPGELLLHQVITHKKQSNQTCFFNSCHELNVNVFEHTHQAAGLSKPVKRPQQARVHHGCGTCCCCYTAPFLPTSSPVNCSGMTVTK